MSRSPNRVLVVVLAAVAVLAVVAAVLAATREPKQYDRGTPEGVVQAYVAAMLDDDVDRAAEQLSQDSPCTAADLDRAMFDREVTVELRDSRTDGDAASVDVDVLSGSGDLFGAAKWTDRHTFRLVREDDGWRITGIPWPVFECGEGRLP